MQDPQLEHNSFPNLEDQSGQLSGGGADQMIAGDQCTADSTGEKDSSTQLHTIKGITSSSPESQSIINEFDDARGTALSSKGGVVDCNLRERKEKSENELSLNKITSYNRHSINKSETTDLITDCSTKKLIIKYYGIGSGSFLY